LGEQIAAALLASQRDTESGVFDFVVTNDRDAVIAAARPVIKRIVAGTSGYSDGGTDPQQDGGRR
jgi:hypothetical protein